jgi:formylglycine-generating enzyme required for sulfatase activity
MTMKTLDANTTGMRSNRVQATLRRSRDPNGAPVCNRLGVPVRPRPVGNRRSGEAALRRSLALPALMALVLGGLAAQAAGPTVSNVRAAQRPGTTLVDVYYDVADPDSGALTVSVAVSTNGGVSYFSPGASVSGALGAGIAPGSNKKLTWNAGVDLPAKLFSNVRVSVTASDDAVPAGMVNIPAGSFQMGDSLDGSSYALPVHTVYVSAFAMDKYPVTKALWDDVYNWASTHGYSFERGAQGKAANHPAHSMTWYDALKWCNARSEKEGRTPAYYTDAGLSNRYRSEQVAPYVNWSSGYRLPTEAEWEKAARGGASGQRFPWGNTITHSQANYYSSTSYAYDTSPTRGYHPSFQAGGMPHTSPVDYFAPNSYGLYDMAGNVWQWCWDRYGSYSSGAQTDPRGPSSGSSRVIRGGCWIGTAVHCRSAQRYDFGPSFRDGGIGFRLVLAPGQ